MIGWSLWMNSSTLGAIAMGTAKVPFVENGPTATVMPSGLSRSSSAIRPARNSSWEAGTSRGASRSLLPKSRVVPKT
eukprot:225012-Pleurochrysis_carterae.AAC.1